jgi:PqqD family protein of HPr-rel-A system
MITTAAEQVVWSDVEGDLVLFHAGTGAYFGLNQLGSTVWRLAAGSMPLAEIVANVRREYDVDEGTAAAEVRRFLASLTSAGLLVSIPRS